MEYDVEAVSGGVSLRSSGTFQDLHDGLGADLTVRFEGPDIGQVLAHLGQPILSEGAFDFRLDLDAQGAMTLLALDGDLGSLHARAEGELDRLVRPTQGRVNGSVTGPDLDALGRALGVSGLAADAYRLEADAAFEPGRVRIRALRLDSAGEYLAVSGVLGTGATLAGSDLALELAAPAARVAAALGKAVQAPDTLRLDGHLATDAGGAATLRARAEYLASELAVDGTLGILSEPLQPDLGIDFRSPDPSPVVALLTALLGPLPGNLTLPAAPAALRGRVARADALLELGGVELELGGHRARANGRVNPAAPYVGSRLDLAIDSPSAAGLGRLFGREGLPAAAFRLTASINRGERHLVFERAELDLAGHHARASGRVAPRLDWSDSELEVEIDSPDAAALGRLFRRPNLPTEPLQLSIAVQGEGKGLTFRTRQADVGEIRLDIEGRIADRADPLGLDARFDVRLPTLALLGFLAPGQELPEQPFSAQGRLEHRPQGTRVRELEAQLGSLRASLQGEYRADRQVDFAVQIDGPDASALEHWSGFPLEPAPFSLRTRLTGAARDLALAGIEARLGESRATGDLRVTLDGGKRVAGRIRFPLLDLGWWNSDAPEKSTEQSTEQSTATRAPGDKVPGDKAPAWVFDDRPITRITDHGVSLELDLGAALLDLGNTQLHELAVVARLSGQRLELEPFSLQGAAGGKYAGRFVLDGAGPQPTVDLQVDGQGVRLGLAAVADQDPATIPETELHVDLHGTGATAREMASGLNGALRLYAGPGLVPAAGLELLFNDFLTELFSLLNPFAEKSPYTRLECSVAAADIVNGLVTVSPLLLNSEEITIFSQGTIDLRTEKIDLSFNTRPRTGLGLSTSVLINPFIKVGGRLAEPAIELDPKSAVVSGSAAVATVGLSLLAKSLSDRFLSSKDPCGDARKEIEKRDE
jgi:hypothetical protein